MNTPVNIGDSRWNAAVRELRESGKVPPFVELLERCKRGDAVCIRTAMDYTLPPGVIDGDSDSGAIIIAGLMNGLGEIIGAEKEETLAELRALKSHPDFVPSDYELIEHEETKFAFVHDRWPASGDELQAFIDAGCPIEGGDQ